MSPSSTLKRKVDLENRMFKAEWKDNFAFILPGLVNAKPLCLICNEVVAVCKEYNVRRHHETKHDAFKVAFPPQTEARKLKIEALAASYENSTGIPVPGLTAQQRVTSASLKASWVLAQHNRPFTEDSEVFKEVMVTVLEELAMDNSMDGIIAAVEQVPLSARYASHRIQVLSDSVQDIVFNGLGQADCFSLAIDESTDNTDVAQMFVYVRYFDGKEFREELLSLITLEGHTTGDIIFTKLEELFRLHSLPFEKVNLIITDGAPAMMGKNRGLVSRLKELVPQMHGLHCLVHQSVLCTRLSDELKEVMDKMMRVIHFVRCTSSTQHLLFQQLVGPEEAIYDDLLLHNDVRWLSQRKALERFCALLDEVKTFLKLSEIKEAADHLVLVENKDFMTKAAFLADVMGHLNQLNLQLQGRGKTVVDMVEKLESFIRKLGLLETDLTTGRLLHFSTLKRHAPGAVTELMVDFIKRLRANFTSRFEDYSIPKDVIAFVRDPLTFRLNVDFSALAKETLPSLDEAAFEMELIDFQTSSMISDAFRNKESVTAFWIACSDEYSTVKKLAFYVLTMFPSTYTCEASFSSMNAIKTQERNRLTYKNLENCLRIKVTSIPPNIRKMVTDERFQFSH